MLSNKPIDLEIKNINDEIERTTTIHEKIAISLSKKIGSMYFIYILMSFMIIWVLINIALLYFGKNPFDKPYDFTILLLLSNSIQLLTPLFLLVSQNIQEKRDKALADQEYLVTTRTEAEMKLTFEYLRDLSDKLKSLLTKLNAQQQHIISMEEKQEEFNNIISSNLMSMLKNTVEQINEKPCLLETVSTKEELADYLIKSLTKYKESIEKDSE